MCKQALADDRELRHVVKLPATGPRRIEEYQS
jgi:hypothetical protein